jgi:hypothetical protein
LNNTIAGNSAANVLRGGAGRDRLTGNGGDDALDGGAGDDTLLGGAGNDAYTVDSVGDIVNEFSSGGLDSGGYDKVTSRAAAYTLSAFVEELTLAPGAGNTHGTGNALANVITGNEGDNVLDGGAGDDTLVASGGKDILSGGEGNDRFEVSGLDVQSVSGGSGVDTVALAAIGTDLDLTSSLGAKLAGIDAIDLSGGGIDRLILDAAALISVSDAAFLRVAGDLGDAVYLGADFAFIGASATGRLYQSGSAIVDVASPLGVQFVMSSSLDLANLSASIGLRIDGGAIDDHFGISAASAGDINGDGYCDFIVGAYTADATAIDSGAAYVVFGTATGISTTIDLAALDGTNGFRLNGIGLYDFSGKSVAAAGDMNRDGYGDIVIGAFGAPSAFYVGEAYVLFGAPGGFASSIDLSSLDGANGFRMHETSTFAYAGGSVSSIGDIDGDGFDDVVVGSQGATADGVFSGSAYVVFGQGGGFSSNLDLLNLDGGNGFRLDGASGGEMAGYCVSAAGDVNGDGLGDVVVGAFRGGPGGSLQGAAYVVFGRDDWSTSSTLDLSTLDGAIGFRLNGVSPGDFAGASVSSAGDVNGDGYDDLMVGADQAAANGVRPGAAYVVFGAAGGFSASIDLSTLDGSTGFRLVGEADGDSAGMAARSAGDINADGYDDLIVGAFGSDVAGADSGVAYVIFGAAGLRPASIDLSALDGKLGFRLEGGAANDWAGISVSSAGDVNGDGFDDLLVGAERCDAGGADSGSTTVLYGGDFRTEADRIGTSGADDITGSSSSDILIGAQGNDSIDGNGGADAINGGSGDDSIHVPDLLFFRIDGGGGLDALFFDTAGTLDFGNIDGDGSTSDRGRISGIEVLDFNNGGSDTLTLHKADVLDIDCQTIDALGDASLDNVLIFDGDTGDTMALALSEGWTKGSTIAGHDIYATGNLRIAVDQDIAVTIA